jgi:hypothetical protein
MFAAISNQQQQADKKKEMLARGASQAEIDRELAEMDKNFVNNVALLGIPTLLKKLWNKLDDL